MHVLVCNIPGRADTSVWTVRPLRFMSAIIVLKGGATSLGGSFLAGLAAAAGFAAKDACGEAAAVPAGGFEVGGVVGAAHFTCWCTECNSGLLAFDIHNDTMHPVKMCDLWIENVQDSHGYNSIDSDTQLLASS